MPADDARPVLPSRTIGPLASDDPESEPPRWKGEGPGHHPTDQATLASHAARWPLLDGPRTGCRDDLVCAQPRYGGPVARFRPQVRRALLRAHPIPPLALGVHGLALALRLRAASALAHRAAAYLAAH